jgi:hypothetical protein
VQRPPMSSRQQAISVDLEERLQAFLRVCRSKKVSVTQVFGSGLTDPEALFEFDFAGPGRSDSQYAP